MLADTLLPLELLTPGERAEIAEIHGESGWIHHLAELGLRSGCHLQVVQSGSPCLLLIGGCRISVRSDLATRIFVRPLADCELAN
jgi:ferrous iron transport protein A